MSNKDVGNRPEDGRAVNCVKCGELYNSAMPALSRDDNKTEICPNCGVRKAGLPVIRDDNIEGLKLIKKNVGVAMVTIVMKNEEESGVSLYGVYYTDELLREEKEFICTELFEEEFEKKGLGKPFIISTSELDCELEHINDESQQWLAILTDSEQGSKIWGYMITETVQ